MTNKISTSTSNPTPYLDNQPTQLNKVDKKTYSFTRKFFEGIALILANIITFGIINIFKAVREEYGRVFVIGNQAITKNETSDKSSTSIQNLPVNSSQTESENPKQKKVIIDLTKIFIKDTKDDNHPKVVIPQEIQESLAEIFGIENIVDEIPTYNGVIDDSFKFENLTWPIMKAMDMNQTPCIFIKFKVADPGAYYDKVLAEADLEFRIEPKIQSGEIPENKKDDAAQKLKKNKLSSVAKKTYYLTFGQSYHDSSKLLWVIKGSHYEGKDPSFLSQHTQLTYPSNGDVINSLKEQIPEFQKLFTEGVGTDVYGNSWKLDLS